MNRRCPCCTGKLQLDVVHTDGGSSVVVAAADAGRLCKACRGAEQPHRHQEPRPVPKPATWQPLCEPCFHRENPGRLPPDVVVGRLPEICCQCGILTRSGISTARYDLAGVPFPKAVTADA